MKEIKELTINEIKIFQVPEKILQNPRNCFWGHTNPSNLDGPWFFMAFVEDIRNSGQISIHYCDIFPESLEWEKFNPLSSDAAFSLSIDEYDNMLSIIKKMNQFYFSENNQIYENCESDFKLLDENEFSIYGLDRGKIDYSSKFPQPNEYYFIKRNTEENYISANELTIIYFNWIPREKEDLRIFFQVMNFSKNKLNDKLFDPRDYALALICLDGKGCLDYINLLEDIRHKVIEGAL